MEKGLISIITPCYNTGSIVHRLLESILAQTYSNVEMYAIDDGSTDNTKEVVESYIPLFKEKGYSLSYIRQANGGQSAAINNGLKLIKGEYIVWPDSDDYYGTPNAFSKMVSTLEKLPNEYSLCRCLSIYINEETLKPTRKVPLLDSFKNEELFEDCLYCQNGFMWGAGNYMARTARLREVNPGMEIFTAKPAGQNWQILLPLFYKQKCFPIAEYLFCILERPSSHSRDSVTEYSKSILKLDVYERTICETLNRISKLSPMERGKFIKKINSIYLKEKALCAFYNMKWHDYKKYRSQCNDGRILNTDILMPFLKYRIIRIIRKFNQI